MNTDQEEPPVICGHRWRSVGQQDYETHHTCWNLVRPGHVHRCCCGAADWAPGLKRRNKRASG